MTDGNLIYVVSRTGTDHTLADVKIYSPEGSLVIEAKTTRYRASFMIDITPRFFISSNYIWQNSLLPFAQSPITIETENPLLASTDLRSFRIEKNGWIWKSGNHCHLVVIGEKEVDLFNCESSFKLVSNQRRSRFLGENSAFYSFEPVENSLVVYSNRGINAPSPINIDYVELFGIVNDDIHLLSEWQTYPTLGNSLHLGTNSASQVVSISADGTKGEFRDPRTGKLLSTKELELPIPDNIDYSPYFVDSDRNLLKHYSQQLKSAPRYFDLSTFSEVGLSSFQPSEEIVFCDELNDQLWAYSGGVLLQYTKSNGSISHKIQVNFFVKSVRRMVNRRLLLSDEQGKWAVLDLNTRALVQK